MDAQSSPQMSHFAKSAAAIALTALVVATTGCQSLRAQSSKEATHTLPSPSAPSHTSGSASTDSTAATADSATEREDKSSGSALKPSKLDSFMINGKIGITTPATATQAAQAGSAFYAWGQQQDRFAIELIGALGLGKTNIEYNGSSATLTSEKTGTLSAASPDELLKKATGWQVPVSQLPYWISGHPAPSDSSQQLDDNGRLAEAVNGDWSASFDYQGNDSLPSKLTARHTQGYKVILTINHQTPQ